MVNYKDGKIYKIVGCGMVYYGSTCDKTLARRLSGHVSSYKWELAGKRKDNVSSFKIIESGDYKIILVEKFPCDSKDELYARERYYIENNECVNICVPCRSYAERLQNQKIEYYCSCGCVVTTHQKARHKRTEKHQHNMMLLSFKRLCTELNKISHLLPT